MEQIRDPFDDDGQAERDAATLDADQANETHEGGILDAQPQPQADGDTDDQAGASGDHVPEPVDDPHENPADKQRKAAEIEARKTPSTGVDDNE